VITTRHMSLEVEFVRWMLWSLQPSPSFWPSRRRCCGPDESRNCCLTIWASSPNRWRLSLYQPFFLNPPVRQLPPAEAPRGVDDAG
jgi:hypothetical protein